MHIEDEPEVAAPNTLSSDERFARAVCTRSLGDLPPLLGADGPALETAVRSLESCARAQQPREGLLLRTLHRTLECAVRSNDDAFGRCSAHLHQLATSLPASSLAGDVAAGLLLLFAHGLGQVLPPPQAALAAPASGPTIVMLGFAGGTPGDLAKYATRLGYDAASTLLMCASEVPEVYGHNLAAVLQRVREAGRPWVVHLFSKAGTA
jgi:hypothetical protein